MKPRAPLAALVLVLAAPPLAAEIYKWTDQDGQVHYTEDPPPDDVQSGDSAALDNEERTRIELPERSLRRYCADIRQLTYKIADAMHRGASPTEMISLGEDSVGTALANSLVSYVGDYEGTGDSADSIASRVHTKCMSGTYSRYVEEYWEKNYPDRPLPGTQEYGESSGSQR